MGTYRDACNSGRFVISGEIGPPKGTNVEKMLHHIDMLKDKVDGLNVTDNQSAVMRLGSLAVSGEIVRRGGDPIFQTTCRDRNRLGLQSDLLSAAFMGITNVLCLTGDHQMVGDHKGAKGVFDFDSVHLIQCCKKMNAGTRLGRQRTRRQHRLLRRSRGHARGRSPRASDVQVRPQGRGRRRLLPDPGRLRHGQLPALHGAGAGDHRGHRRQDHGRTGGAHQRGHGQVHEPGRPRDLRARRPARGDGRAYPRKRPCTKGMEIAARHIRFLRDNKVCDGVHIMAIGKEEIIPEILAMAGAE